MPVEISVGTPVLSINHGSTFMVTDLSGEIEAESELGVFSNDTRYVSYYAIFANGEPWVRLSSATTAYYAARIYLTNQAFSTESGDVPAGTLTLTVSRSVGEGVHEELEVTNFGLTPASFNVEVALRCDFADIFETRWHQFVRRGRIETVWDPERGELCTSYANRDFRRSLTYRVTHCETRPHYANGRVTFELVLDPGATWQVCCDYVLTENDTVHVPAYKCRHSEGALPLADLQQRWERGATRLRSANEEIYRLYRQSVEDMGALRLYDHDFAPDVWVPAAGVPWYVTIFGRDSLIVSMQNMMVHAGFARGALRKLAQFQATAMDDWRDAEPGKILHEIRFGELAHFKRIPHTPYYGTADATPLYLIVLHEAWKWLGDAAMLRDYREVALRCLEWIDRYGDLDGDGFQEYKTRSSKGYENMGWKDAKDAVVYPDGSQVPQPKALCELQGYVFDAWMRSAELFDVLREPERARELRHKAAALRTRFEEAFWCEEIESYAFGLDPEKRQIRTVSSNAGHCLWSGIASPEHAARVVRRLMQPDMWSGWGIRTLSAENPAYNPTSYHTGSVWPHDNGIIALGFRRYGFAAETARIARDISEAASYFVGHRLPELYAGFSRAEGTFPVQYLGANVPQAWAAGSVFHLLQALLGLHADAPNGRLYVDPYLPQWLPSLVLQGLTVGDAMMDIHFWREDGEARWDVAVRRGTIEVEQRPWHPWLAERPSS
jgi:glycogen debranching enzyme